MTNWQIRAGKGGVCDFRSNYDFYFKWLTNKVMSCFIISDDEKTERTESIDWDYFKLNLLLDGEICVTNFNEKLYACIGARGGEPDEYYIPKIFTIANPILGSKQVKIGIDGVVIYNTKVDKFCWTSNGTICSGGLFDLISQTATLLADNIISINCNQINSRVATFFTSDDEAQAVAGEIILKKMYAGKPYQIIRSSLMDKINVNPVNSDAAGQNISELIELHNYLISSFFQNIGIQANNVMKKERLITDEVESQRDYLQINILEILSSWQAGLNEVNELYGTKFQAKLNPVLVPELLYETETADGEAATEPEPEPEPEPEQTADGEAAAEPEPEPEPEQTADGEAAAEPEPDPEEKTIEDIEEKEKAVEAIVDIINDDAGKGDEENESDQESESDTDQ